MKTELALAFFKTINLQIEIFVKQYNKIKFQAQLLGSFLDLATYFLVSHYKL